MRNSDQSTKTQEDMGAPQNHHAEWKKPETIEYTLEDHLYEVVKEAGDCCLRTDWTY